MSVANVFELTRALTDLLSYCEKNPRTTVCKQYQPALAAAHKEFHGAIEATDGHFSAWRMESGDDRLAWKHLSAEVARTQGMLKRVGAIGFPDQQVKYWDLEILEGLLGEVVAYLKGRADHISFASEQAEKLERLHERAQSEQTSSGDALKTYKRHVKRRSDALNNASNMIGSMRKAMRLELGREHPDYHAIGWPHSVATDENVL